MTLTQQQKALAENIIMVIDEETSDWHHIRVGSPEEVIFRGFQRVKMILQHVKPGRLYINERYILAVARMVGKEVRRARYYNDMTAEEITEALDTTLKILKGED